MAKAYEFVPEKEKNIIKKLAAIVSDKLKESGIDTMLVGGASGRTAAWDRQPESPDPDRPFTY